MKKQANLIVSNTDEGKRDAQTRVEGNRLIVSNTDELVVSNTDKKTWPHRINTDDDSRYCEKKEKKEQIN